MTKIILVALFLSLAGLGYMRDDHNALAVGLLCTCSVLLAAILLPQHPASIVTSILGRLFGWCLVLFAAGTVADYATDGLSTQIIAVVWKVLI